MFRDLKYPTSTQNRIWSLRRKQVRPVDIAEQLSVSKAFISKSQRIAEERIDGLMRHAARSNRIRLDRVSPQHGFAQGYCAAYDARTYITYSPKIGVQMWLDHTGDCSGCSELKECTRILKTLSEEWDLEIDESVPPTERASKLFQSMRRKLEWCE
ncbi:MAG: hypothetical protein DRO87_09360 [Candidatus Thorarchaeota archaeon]|nr:MAG: hypothetical protein DRP09_13125 [Candidatus Thorarchaeota archaeon]RLI55109.1 MAG: hypothetical protein DRO87_09360 [Candidatus Thorarchaeota archaeon]